MEQEFSCETMFILHELDLGQHTLFIMSDGSIDLLAHDGRLDLVIHVGDSKVVFLNQQDRTFKPAPTQ